MANQKTCKWTRSKFDSVLVKTECRHLYCGGLEHLYIFCPYCGKKIKLAEKGIEDGNKEM